MHCFVRKLRRYTNSITNSTLFVYSKQCRLFLNPRKHLQRKSLAESQLRFLYRCERTNYFPSAHAKIVPYLTRRHIRFMRRTTAVNENIDKTMKIVEKILINWR